MAYRSPPGSGPSQRQLRVGELVRRKLADVLLRGDVHDPDLNRHSITVGEVRTSTDLKVATVYVLPLGGHGAEEALAALRSAKSAIATSCAVPLARARIQAAGLQPPSVLVTVDDVAHGKPAPDPFLEAARRLGADPARCLVVEDAPMGLKGAHAAGCFTLAVVTTTKREDLDADAVVGDLSEVEFVPGEDGIRIRLRG